MIAYNYEWVLGASRRHCAVCYSLAGVVQSMDAWASSVQPGFHGGCGCSLRRTLASASVIVPQLDIFLGVGVAHGGLQDDHLEWVMLERLAARLGDVGERMAESLVGSVVGERYEDVALWVDDVEALMGVFDESFGRLLSPFSDQPVTNYFDDLVGEVAAPEPERLQPSPPPDAPAPSVYEEYVVVGLGYE